MKELAPHVATRWYMVAVLLDISKPTMDRISKGFIANGNINYSLSEVVEAWLEEKNATDPELSAEISRPGERGPSSYWIQVCNVLKRMGHVTFAAQLGVKHSGMG